MNKSGTGATPTPRPQGVESSDALWRKLVEGANSNGALQVLLDSGANVDSLERESVRRFCLRGHELSAVRRGALRSSADDVTADALKFRGGNADGASGACTAGIGERERMREAVTRALSSRCVIVDEGGKLRGACGEDGESELGPEEHWDTILLLHRNGKSSKSEVPSSLVSQLASMSLGDSDPKDAEAVGRGKQMAAAAKFLGSALQSHLGGDIVEDAEAGAAAARSISKSINDASGPTPKAPSAGITSRVFSGASALGAFSYRLAAGAVGAASYAARAAGLADEGDDCAIEEYCAESGLDGGRGDDYGDADDNKTAEVGALSGQLDDRADDDDLAAPPSGVAARRWGAADLGRSDHAVSSVTVVRCCAAVLRHAELRIKSEEHRLEDAEGEGRVLLSRTDDGPRSFRQFCRSAGEAMLASAATEEEAAYGRALSCLGPADTELVALTLLSSRRVAASPDGDVLALYPSGAPTTKDGKALGEVDAALFKMRAAADALERRMEQLTDQSEVAAAAAVKAKRAGASRAALGHVRRRKLLVEELDRCSATLLNLETASVSLRRARNDARALKCYEMAARAMKMVRAPEEEGGMGLTAERAEDAAEGLAEEMEELNAVGGVMAELGSASVVVDEDELLKELSELESEVNLDSGREKDATDVTMPKQDSSSSRDESVADEGFSASRPPEGSRKETEEIDSREEVSIQSTARLKMPSE